MNQGFFYVFNKQCIVLYCIFVLLEENIADRTQQMEQANLTKVIIPYVSSDL